MTATTEKTIIDLTQRLLDAIGAGDWKTYTELCDPDLTAFEPEALGHLVHGLTFHRFYFSGQVDGTRRQNTLIAPKVWLTAEAAVIAYVRLVQRAAPDGVPVSSRAEETRVWRQRDGRWQMVHFHRSVFA